MLSLKQCTVTVTFVLVLAEKEKYSQHQISRIQVIDCYCQIASSALWVHVAFFIELFGVEVSWCVNNL